VTFGTTRHPCDGGRWDEEAVDASTREDVGWDFVDGAI
jgi:hypothetical protein